MAALAAPYLPRRPTETVLYEIVRQNLESFLAYTRQHYDGGLPRYVESELRAYLKCGLLSEGFTRARCDVCGHDLLVPFSCKSRTVCPSCSGRRMANEAAAIVDRVLPDVPMRQYVLTLPYELRKLAAFKADVLTALGRIFVDAVFTSYRAGAKRDGVVDGQCGAINFVQRFGSLNLNVHFHLAMLDGVFTRDAQAGMVFHPQTPPAAADLDSIARRVRDRSVAWLRRHGYLDDRPFGERSNESPAQTALDACAVIAIGRGQLATLPRAETVDAAGQDHDLPPERTGLAVDLDGFNLHAGVRIEAGDDLGRERLVRYGARPPLCLDRLRRLPGGRVAYRLKYVARGRAKFRVMTGMEFMARLAAIIAPPRYPLLRYAGALGPRSAWRRDVVPKPRNRPPSCGQVAPVQADDGGARPRAEPIMESKCPRRSERPRLIAGPLQSSNTHAHAVPVVLNAVPRRGDVIALAQNVLSIRHWDRILGGVLYATTPRIDWARLLRRSLGVDALKCPKCHGRLRVLAVITESESVQRLLAHLGLPTDAPPLARARDPTDDTEDADRADQLGLGFA